MSLIERLQRLDGRLGLDSPEKWREQEERRAALRSLPQPVRRSLTRLRVAVLLGLSGALVGVGLPMFLSTSMGDITVIVLSFLGAFAGIFIGRWLERRVLEKHSASASSDAVNSTGHGGLGSDSPPSLPE